MAIGLMNNLFTPYQRGGAEVVTQRLAAELIAQGERVFLITTRPKGTGRKLDQEAETAARLKCPIYYLDSKFRHLAQYSSGQRLIWQISNLFNCRKYQQIKKILQAEKPELVITHNLMGLGLLIPKLLKNLHIRQKHYLHDIQLLYPSGLMLYGQEKKMSSWPARLYQALARRLISSPETVISPSAWLLAEHEKRGFFTGSKKEIQPFKRPVDYIPRTASATGKKTWLFVGQIEIHKGIFFLLETFKKITEPTVRLIIVGDGQKLAEAKKIAAPDKRIDFLGRLNELELKQIIAQADCLVVPSLCYENSPTIIYEAQAAGCPVVAANLGGIPEIVNDKRYLFQPNNQADLLEKLNYFL